MDSASLTLPQSSYWAITIWAFVVFVVWYFFRHSSGSRSSRRFAKTVALISLPFLGFIILQWHQSRPRVNPLRIAVFPFPKHADTVESISWESVAITELTSEALAAIDRQNLVVYDLESIMAVVNFDSLSNRNYIVALSKRINLNYVVFGSFEKGTSRYSYNFALLDVRNASVLSEGAKREQPDVLDICRDLYREIGTTTLATNGGHKAWEWASGSQLENYFNARLYYLTDQIQPALELAAAAVSEDSASISCLNFLAELCIQSGIKKKENGQSALDDFRLANAILTKSLGLNSSLGKTNRILATLYLANEKWLKAEQSLTKAREFAPLDPRVYFHFTQLHPSRYRNLGFGSEVELLKHASYLNGAFVEPYLYLAEYYDGHKRPDLAMKAVNQALSISPNHVDALMLLGSFYLAQKQTLEVLQIYEKVLDLQPDNGDVYYNIGIVYYYEKNYDEAIKYFQHAIELNDHLDSHLYLAYIYEWRGETDQAVEHLRARIQKRKNDEDRFAEEARQHLFRIMSEQGIIDSLMIN